MLEDIAHNIAAALATTSPATSPPLPAATDHTRGGGLDTGGQTQGIIQDGRNQWPWLVSDPAFTGKAVTEQSALSLAAVYACIRVIAEDCATIPVKLYRQTGGQVAEVRNHPVIRLLPKPNRYNSTGLQFREAIMVSLLTNGNAYTENIRNGAGQITELLYLDSRQTLPYLTTEDVIYYEATDLNQRHKLLLADQVAHFRGLTQTSLMGLNPIQQMRQALGQAIAQDEFAARFFANGAKVRDTLEMEGVFKNDGAANRTKADWKAATAGDNAWKTPILESGMQYKLHTINLRDLQFLEAKKFSVEEIARIYRVPPHKIQHLERATFNNIAELGIGYYTDTLRPWLERLEATMNISWLTPGERARGLYFEHDFERILRANPKEAAETDRALIESGIRTRNEVRARRSDNPIEGGDVLQVPMNHQTLDDFINGRQFQTTPKPGDNDPKPPQKAEKTRQIALEPNLEPIARDILDQLRTKEANAIGKLRDKHPTAADLAGRINHFLKTHRDHIRRKLQPLAQALGAETVPDTLIDDRLDLLRDLSDPAHPISGQPLDHQAPQHLLQSLGLPDSA